MWLILWPSRNARTDRLSSPAESFWCATARAQTFPGKCISNGLTAGPKRHDRPALRRSLAVAALQTTKGHMLAQCPQTTHADHCCLDASSYACAALFHSHAYTRGRCWGMSDCSITERSVLQKRGRRQGTHEQYNHEIDAYLPVLYSVFRTAEFEAQSPGMQPSSPVASASAPSSKSQSTSSRSP